jgi:hypothetical protein
MPTLRILFQACEDESDWRYVGATKDQGGVPRRVVIPASHIQGGRSQNGSARHGQSDACGYELIERACQELFVRKFGIVW